MAEQLKSFFKHCRVFLMKFFAPTEEVEYPDNQPQLEERILHDAIHLPHKIALAYLDLHFDANGGRNHPILGDLTVLASKIEALWDEEVRGKNLVAGKIRFKFPLVAEAAVGPLF